MKRAREAAAGQPVWRTPEATPLSLDGIDQIDFGPDGVIPAIVQDLHTREVLMPGFTTREMVRRTLETGNAWFWSRSRQQPWLKGETSGNVIRVREVRRNCEDNALLYLSEPVGPVCHTGQVGCFYRQLDGTVVEIEASYRRPSDEYPGTDGREQHSETGSAAPADDGGPGAGAGTLEWLWHIVEARRRERPEGSYVVKLLDQGVDRIAKKVGEEAAEVIIAAKNRSADELANEMADLWFHSLLILLDAGLTPADVYHVLAARHRPH